MKQLIEEMIQNEDYENAQNLIRKYEQVRPYDSDILTYKSLCMLGINDYEKGLEYAILAVKQQPYIADVHFNCGYAYELCGKLCNAYEQYRIAEQLIEGGNVGDVTIDVVNEVSDNVLKKITEKAENGKIDSKEKNWLEYIISQNNTLWDVIIPIFHSEFDILGKEYKDYPQLRKEYLGVSGLQASYKVRNGLASSNTVFTRTEMQRTTDKQKYVEFDLNETSYIPIIAEEEIDLLFNIQNDSTAIADIYDVGYSSPLQYANYRVPRGKIKISSDEPFRIGKIVPIVHSKERKRLVLNIFIDGLSQTVLREHFRELMPHTYKFFEKGIKCDNAHTAGDWTFPSIAAITTGQTLAKHKMLHSKLYRKIDIETPILFEYFEKAGYNTTKIGGNWRIAPNYGYARGMNRVKYQHMYLGYNVDEVINDVEEQLHTMKDTDQFIWMEIGELHLIADEINMAPLQSEVMVWENKSSSGKVNSVKQNYDETKKMYYEKQIAYIDRKLASLYQYIEENYIDKDIVVSLFSDHGQGYLVKPESEFLCDERTNIAFMFRCDGLMGNTDEVISSCDYPAIMCKLAGIDYNYNNTDANLPVIFKGEKERDFAVTESIHVGDPYQILLNGKDFQFYLKGKENVTSDCRVPLDNYEVKLIDRNGNNIDDEDRRESYTKWCLEHIGTSVIYND